MPRDRIKKTSRDVATQPYPNLEEEIRHRAYEFYEARGCGNGREMEDWLRAEQEITGKKGGVVTAS